MPIVSACKAATSAVTATEPNAAMPSGGSGFTFFKSVCVMACTRSASEARTAGSGEGDNIHSRIRRQRTHLSRCCRTPGNAFNSAGGRPSLNSWSTSLHVIPVLLWLRLHLQGLPDSLVSAKRFLLHRRGGGTGHASDFCSGHPRDLQHDQHFTLALG